MFKEDFGGFNITQERTVKRFKIPVCATFPKYLKQFLLTRFGIDEQLHVQFS